MTVLSRTLLAAGVAIPTSGIVVPSGKVAAFYEACGGPSTPVLGGDGFQAGPTDSGEFVIAGCWKHSSQRYPDWSGIPWGTPLRVGIREIEVKVNSIWEPLSKYSTVTKSDIEDYHNMLFGTAKIPSTWKFNDFGHMSCYIFTDKNRNKIFDKNSEKIHGELFHTTPLNEAQTERGLKVELEESHGCIHVKPKDIDEMIAKSYLKKGNLVYIHPYTRLKPDRKIDSLASAPFEVHFFPGSKKLMVVGV